MGTVAYIDDLKDNRHGLKDTKPSFWFHGVGVMTGRIKLNMTCRAWFVAYEPAFTALIWECYEGSGQHDGSHVDLMDNAGSFLQRYNVLISFETSAG